MIIRVLILIGFTLFATLNSSAKSVSEHEKVVQQFGESIRNSDLELFCEITDIDSIYYSNDSAEIFCGILDIYSSIEPSNKPDTVLSCEYLSAIMFHLYSPWIIPPNITKRKSTKRRSTMDYCLVREVNKSKFSYLVWHKSLAYLMLIAVEEVEGSYKITSISNRGSLY